MNLNFNSRRKLQVGPMHVGQFAECAAIHADAFAVGWTENELEALAADRNVASDCVTSGPGGQVHGFVLSRMVLDEAEILTVIVKKNFRNKGTGRELLQHHIKKLEQIGIKSIYLEVAENNHPAVKLYKRLGFHQIGVRKSYYPGADGGRVAALTMKLAII